MMMSNIAGIRSSTKRQLTLLAMLFLGVYGIVGSFGYTTSESLIAFFISIISTYMGYSIKEDVEKFKTE